MYDFQPKGHDIKSGLNKHVAEHFLPRLKEHLKHGWNQVKIDINLDLNRGCAQMQILNKLFDFLKGMKNCVRSDPLSRKLQNNSHKELERSSYL